MSQAMSKIINNDRLTPQDAANFLGVSVGTLAVWRCTKKEIIPYIKVGHKVMYQRQDLDAWLQSKRVLS